MGFGKQKACQPRGWHGEHHSPSVSAKTARLDEKGAVEFGIFLLERVGNGAGATCLLIVGPCGDDGGDELEVFFCHILFVWFVWFLNCE
jgi:hypothetical protein